MSVKTIIGLDPGNVTGYGVVTLDNGVLAVVKYGAIPVATGVHPLVALYHWLEEECWRLVPPAVDGGGVAFEELLDGKGMTVDRCPRAAKEANGAIRLFLELRGIRYAAYHSSTIKAAFSASKKLEVRKAVEDITGLNLKGYTDHAADALAVAIVYASREHGWQLVNAKPLVEPKRRGPRSAKAELLEELDFSLPENREKLIEAMKTGTIRPVKGRTR